MNGTATSTTDSPGCLTCHKAHAAKEAKLLGEPISQVCEQCHAAGETDFKEAHLGIDAKRMACASCHDPHSSKDQMMFKQVTHPPFVARQCDSCHALGKESNR